MCGALLVRCWLPVHCGRVADDVKFLAVFCYGVQKLDVRPVVHGAAHLLRIQVLATAVDVLIHLKHIFFFRPMRDDDVGDRVAFVCPFPLFAECSVVQAIELRVRLIEIAQT